MREYEDTIQFLNQRKEISDVVKKIQQHETELRELGVEDYDRCICRTALNSVHYTCLQ